MFLLVSCGNIGVPERDSNMGVWKSRKPESGKEREQKQEPEPE